MTEKNTGVRKMPNSVTPTMPLKTAIPSDRRISAPAPVATASGITPRMKANEVIRIGRSRSRHASSVASWRDRPSTCICLAYSTIRMAFLHARPTSTTRPICTKMLTSRPVNSTPATRAEQAQRHHQDDRQRQRPALVQGRQGQEDARRPPARRRRSRCCPPGSAGTSARSTPPSSTAAGFRRPVRSMALMASPELTPAAMLPVIDAAV